MSPPMQVRNTGDLFTADHMNSVGSYIEWGEYPVNTKQLKIIDVEVIGSDYNITGSNQRLVGSLYVEGNEIVGGGHLQIGTTYDSTRVLSTGGNIYSSNFANIQTATTWTPTSSGQGFGIHLTTALSGSSDASLFSMFSALPINAGGHTGSLTNLKGLLIAPLWVNNAGLVTNYYGVDIRPLYMLDDSITNTYGLNISNVPRGITSTYAIKTGTGSVSFGDHVEIQQDNSKLIFGTGNDASIYYDGTDLHIDPDGVGTGDLIVSTQIEAPYMAINGDAEGVGVRLNVNGYTNLRDHVGIGGTSFQGNGPVLYFTLTSADDTSIINCNNNTNANGNLNLMKFDTGIVATDHNKTFKAINITSTLDGNTNTVNLGNIFGVDYHPTINAPSVQGNILGYYYHPTYLTSGSPPILAPIYITQTDTSGISPIDSYGIFIDDIPVGTNSTYSIKTGSGKVSFGDNVEIISFNVAGFVKNDSSGILSGGNTISVSDITDIATTYLKLDASNDPITGALQLNNTFTIGSNTSGSDVIFYGSTDGKFLIWDTSENLLEINGNIHIEDGTNRVMDLRSGVEIGTNANNDNQITNTVVGVSAGQNSTGWVVNAQNVFVGNSAGVGNATPGAYSLLNFALGFDALGDIGGNAGSMVISNSALGTYALQTMEGGTANIALGQGAAATLKNGNYNIIIGYNASVPTATSNYALNIGGIIKGNLQTGSQEVNFPFDNMKTTWGVANDSYIDFDGDSMNIVANNVTPSDCITITSNNFNLDCAGNIRLGTGSYFEEFYQDYGDLYSELGKAYFGNGLNLRAEQYGAGVLVRQSSPTKTELYNIDAIFNVGSLQIQKAGQTFLSDGVVAGNFVVLTSGSNAAGSDFTGAIGEILKVEEEALYINVASAGADIIDEMGGLNFVVINAPVAGLLDNGDIHFSIGAGSTSRFNIKCNDSVSAQTFNLQTSANRIGHRSSLITVDANGVGGVSGQTIYYNSGDLGSAQNGAGLFVSLDISGIGSPDESISIPAVVVGTTNSSTATTKAFLALPGFDIALQVQGASAEDLDYGYEVTSGVVVDRVNSGGGGNDAFTNSAVNEELFANDDDYILIGKSSTFEIVEYIASVQSSKNIIPTFQYSTGNGTWNTLPIRYDGTFGFKNSGQISFTAPVDWDTSNQAESPGDISSAYYLKITRTYGPTIPTLPTERLFQLYESRSTGMDIRGDGTIKPTSLADVDAQNESIYYSTTQSKLVFKDSVGSINDLY